MIKKNGIFFLNLDEYPEVKNPVTTVLTFLWRCPGEKGKISKGSAGKKSKQSAFQILT